MGQEKRFCIIEINAMFGTRKMLGKGKKNCEENHFLVLFQTESK